MKEGHNVSGWVSDVTVTDNKMPGSNVVFTAQWVVNSYTVTFMNDGVVVKEETLGYNETITYSTNLTKKGYAFNGWEPKPERMAAHDVTVVAQWVKGNSSEYIEIVIDKKDLTKEEVEKIIKKTTNDEIEIIKFEEDKDTGEVKISSKFKDAEEAKNFVDAIKETSEVAIASINFLSVPPESAASKVSLFMALGLMFL